MRASFVLFGLLLGCGSDDPAPNDSGSSGNPTTTTAACATDPAAATKVGAFLDTLGGAGPKGDLRGKVTDAIVRACDTFGPPEKNGWKKEWCWAHLASEILKESSYRADSVVTDSNATRTVAGQKANDPTVGLMQIRFSSVVHNFAAQGPADRLACVGCTLPADLDAHKSEPGDSTFWAVSGPQAHLSTMEDVACNVGLGAWYVYLNATGNGKTSAPTFLDAYCKGQGTAANLMTGFRSFVDGPSAGKGIIADEAAFQALKTTDSNVFKYVTAVRGTFDGMITDEPSPHPFFVVLSPNPTQYCR